MTMFDWTTSRQADLDTKAAERKKIAVEGTKHLKLIWKSETQAFGASRFLGD